MAKWADYLISAVRYKDPYEKDQIDKVKVHICNLDNTPGNAQVWKRKEVVSKLENNYTFYTIYKGGKKGSKVEIFTLNGVKYIRTDGNKKKYDNLEELPEF